MRAGRFVVALLAAALLAVGCSSAPGVTCRSHDTCAGLEEGYCSRAEICTKECDPSRPCPQGSICSPEPGRTVCLPACAQDSDCPAWFSCQGADGGLSRCVLTRPLGPPPP